MAIRFLRYGTALLAGAALAATACGNSSPNQAPDAPPPPPPPPADAASPPIDAPATPIDAPPAAPSALQIKTLGNRADLISGGDALVEIVLPAGTTAANLHVAVGNVDESSAFAVRANGRVIGVLTGLANGANTVTADLGGANAAKLTITNHKIGGPVLSGAQVFPFLCATPTAQAATNVVAATNASGLSTTAVDIQCNIATEAKLWYHSNVNATTPGTCNDSIPDPATAPAKPSCFKAYDPTAAAQPADLDTATLENGNQVPYIVRVERGTLNRGIFDIAVLFDPTKDDPQTGWKPFAPQASWNGKVLYTFGASSGQPRRQFRSEQNWTDNTQALTRGYLVALNSMTDSLFNSNRISMSETVMMMKEHITDSYGEIKFTIGNGCSGGSINQLTTASVFPGLLDGIQPTCTYSDSESTAVEVADCAQLVNFYNSAAWTSLLAQEGITDQVAINAKKAAINGHIDQSGCHAWVNSFSNLGRPGNYVPVFVINQTTGATAPVGASTNNCQLLPSQVYDPVNNPFGTRCTGSDHDVAIVGADPFTGRARTTNDNVGVQYGLKAFLSGAITGDEFVTLNTSIGGEDADSNFTAGRSVGDASALAALYRAGMVSDGAHLSQLPIIDLRGFDDTSLPPIATPGAFGIHHIWRSFALRARLDGVGGHGNHVMWRYGTGLVASPASGLTPSAFLTMDQWVGAIKADTSSKTLAQKVVDNKPAAAFDFCYLSTDTTFANKITDASVCAGDVHLAPHSSPRQVAGGPIAENILKCQLKAIDRNDYAGAVTPLTDAQFNALKAAFPGGVCDFSRPGVGQQAAISPLDFSAGPGGQPLPAAPVSTAL